MATFKKGQSFKNQRVHVSSAFDQTGKGMTGKNVAFSIANDTREPDDVITNPMLVYDEYKNSKGEMKPTYTASYSKEQWEKIEQAANKDGDNMVLNADLFPNKNGKGLVVNTNKLETPDTPFNKDAHVENTKAAREAKKAAAAEKEEAKAQAAESEKEAELE